MRCLALVAILSAVDTGLCRVARIGSTRSAEYLNPDIAVGSRFYVAAKQWDGTLRCYFIEVGNRIEQGPINIRSNKHCERSYRKEIALGRYNGTLPPESSPVGAFLQQYAKGDSVHCGTVNVGRQDRKGLVDPSSGPKAKQVRRQTTLVMLKNEGHVAITASVREPRKCRYEVVLEGPELLLLGGPSGGVAPIEPVAEEVTMPKASLPRKPQSSGVRSSAGGMRKTRVSASEARKNDKYREAVTLVQQSSHEDLVSRPAKELKKLLRSLGAECKACNEKMHLVDRLNEIVRGKDEL